VDRITRKELKSDKFAQEVGHSLDFLSTHRSQVMRYGAAALALIVIGAGIYFFMQYRANERKKALAQALHTMDATVGASKIAGALSFESQAEKDKAVDKALRDLAMNYGGSAEGSIARYYLGIIAADKGDLAQAEKSFQDVIENGPKHYASLASISLAQLYSGQGKGPEAEKLLRGLIANPTVTVSKEMATIELGRALARVGRKEEARKLLEPLRTERTAVSKAAISALADIQSN
jgi:TolA-binding protein